MFCDKIFFILFIIILNINNKDINNKDNKNKNNIYKINKLIKKVLKYNIKILVFINKIFIF